MNVVATGAAPRESVVARPGLSDRSSWSRYLPGGDEASALGIRELSYGEYELHNPNGAIVERSMLAIPELALLFMLARDHYSGAGEIVDLGPLLGVGTNALARGLRQNGLVADKRERIHSFDLFLAKGMGPVITGASRAGAVLDRFLRNNLDYIEHLSVNAGDFSRLAWDRSPVEILFIDIAKSWDLNRHVLRQFFPYLVPGRSIVVQQDYAHFAEPWVALTMEVFAEYFEHLYFVAGSTSVYRYVKQIPNELLHAEHERSDTSAKVRLFEGARAKAPADVAEILKCGQAYVLAESGRYDEARALLESVARVRCSEDASADFSESILPNQKAAADFLRSKAGVDVALPEASRSNRLVAELDVVLARGEVRTSDQLTGTVRVRNVGSSAWSLVPAPVGTVNLGAHLRDADTREMVEFDFLRRHVGPEALTTLAPGDEVAFEIGFRAPAYGRYLLEFDLVSEMVCWFEQNGSRTTTIPITVR